MNVDDFLDSPNAESFLDEKSESKKVEQPSIYAPAKEWEAYRAAQRAGTAEPKRQEGIGPIQPFRLGETARTVGKTFAGMAEAPLAAVTGGVGTVAGGVAGLGRTVAGMLLSDEGFDQASSAGADLTRSVKSGLSYDPKTEFGQGIMTMAGAPITLGSQALGSAGRAAGSLVGPKTAAALETVGEAAPEAAAALYGARALRKSMPTGRAPLNQEQSAIRSVMDDGFKVLPSEARPGSLSATAESGAYTPALIKETTLYNQKHASDLVKQELGLSPTQPLNYDTLETMRGSARNPVAGVQNYSLPYDRIKAIPDTIDVRQIDPTFPVKARDLDKSFQSLKQLLPEMYHQPALERLRAGLYRLTTATPKQLLETIQSLRATAARTLQTAQSNDNAFFAAKSMKDGAALLEGVLDNYLQQTGRSQLYSDFVNARKQIAKTYDAESMLVSPTRGSIDPQVARGMLKNGDPLSGNFLKVARAADTIPSVVRNPSETEARSVGGIRMGISTPLRKSLQSRASQSMLKPKGDVERPPFRMGEATLGAFGAGQEDEGTNR